MELVTILIAMLGLAIAALFCVGSVRSRYRFATQMLEASLSPIEDDAALRAPEVTWDERFLEVIPGVMLVAGLFGTFLGLANAINSAGDAIRLGGTHSAADLERQFNALAGAIDGIGVKFLSSLAGIGLHLGLRLAIGLWVLPVREGWRRLVDRQLDLRRAFREVARRQHDADVLKYLRASAECLEDLRRHVTTLSMLPQAVLGEVKALASASEANRETVALLRGAVQDARAAQQHTTDGLVQIRSAVQEAAAAQLAVSNSVRESNATRASADRGWVESLKTVSATFASRLAGEAESVSGAMKSGAGEFSREMLVSTSSFSKALAEHLEEHSKSIALTLAQESKGFSQELSQQLNASIHAVEVGCSSAIGRFADRLDAAAQGFQSAVDTSRSAVLDAMNAGAEAQRRERAHSDSMVDARVQRLESASGSIHTAVSSMENTLRDDRSAWAQVVSSAQESGWREVVGAIREEHARTRADLSMLRPDAPVGAPPPSDVASM